jgi:hypothetical protein
MTDDLVAMLKKDFSLDTKHEYPQTCLTEYEYERQKAADRIEKLEAENAKLKNGMWGIIGLCKWGVNRTPSFCSEPEGYCHCMKAFNALDYDLSNAYPID